jgi:hypothetical protein
MLRLHDHESAVDCLPPSAKPAPRYHERQAGRFQGLANIADEVSQVLLVFKRVGFATAIIPALVPAETFNSRAMASELGKLRGEVLNTIFDAQDEVVVEISDPLSPLLSTAVGSGTRWAPGASEACSSGAELEEENGVIKVVANHPSETEFGANSSLGGPVPYSEPAPALEPRNPYVFSGNPSSVVMQVSIACGGGRVPGQGFKGSFLFASNPAVTFHV